MDTFDRYKQNLKYDDDYIYSYGTKVASRHVDHIKILGKWSRTTDKHIIYASRELGVSRHPF